MIHSLHLDSFYLTDDQLENSPSRQDGIDKDTEANLRMYGCEVIQEAGIMLSFDQVFMATGQVLLHRFYCKRSMKTFNVKVGVVCPCAVCSACQHPQSAQRDMPVLCMLISACALSEVCVCAWSW
jgi:hypothetical protein